MDIIKAVFDAFARDWQWENHGDAAEVIRKGKVHWMSDDKDWGDAIDGRPLLAQMGDQVSNGDRLYLTAREGSFKPEIRTFSAVVGKKNIGAKS